jgi:HAD superfamily hydrolase (TIGR01509 family)
MIDNTLYHKRAWIEFCRRHGINLTEEGYLTKVSGKRNDAILEMLFERRIAPDEQTQLEEEKESIYREIYGPNLKANGGLIGFLDKLSLKKLKIGIATTSPYKNRIFVLEALKLQNFFAVIVGSEDTLEGKPHPEIYLKTAEKLGFSPGECLAFEDTPSGIKSAKSAGIKTVIAVLTSHSKEELYEADFYIKDFTEIEV